MHGIQGQELTEGGPHETSSGSLEWRESLYQSQGIKGDENSSVN